jgi:hypothetical protein
MRRRLLNFTLDLPKGWRDITGELPGDPPPTLAKTRGVGAIQFSQAEFEGGPPETLDEDDLLEMVRGIAKSADQFIAFDEHAIVSGRLRIGAVSMALEGNFVRLWGVSDGSGIVLATYTCSWKDRHVEVDECSRLLKSIRLVAPAIVGIA